MPIYGISLSRTAGLNITGGLVENNGLIEITSWDGNFDKLSHLRLIGDDVVLTGSGTVDLENGAILDVAVDNEPVRVRLRTRFC